MKHGRLRFDTFELDLQTGELHKDGSRIHLQEQPMRLLALLANRPGELVTREEIHKELWKDGEFVEFEHGVNTAIHKIRAALDDNSENSRIIQTIPRKGYRFIAAVANADEGGSTTVAPNPREAQPRLGADDFVLPISLTSCRILFLLAQIPYVGSYLATFFYLNELDAALIRIFPFIPVKFSLPAMLLLALVGFAVRVYLIGLVGWGHTEAGPRYRMLFPYVFPLDAIWAATPLLVDVGGPLLSFAGLILMGWLVFGQRTLMRSIEQRQKEERGAA